MLIFAISVKPHAYLVVPTSPARLVNKVITYNPTDVCDVLQAVKLAQRAGNQDVHRVLVSLSLYLGDVSDVLLLVSNAM